MISTVLHQVVTSSRVASTTVLPPAAMAVSARYASSMSRVFSTNANKRTSSESAKYKPRRRFNFSNDHAFDENEWLEKFSDITEHPPTGEKLETTLVTDHSFDVNEGRAEKTPDIPKKAEPAVAASSWKPVFDKPFSHVDEQEPNKFATDHTFDENDFADKVTHIQKGGAAAPDKVEVFVSDHAFDVNEGADNAAHNIKSN